MYVDEGSVDPKYKKEIDKAYDEFVNNVGDVVNNANKQNESEQYGQLINNGTTQTTKKFPWLWIIIGVVAVVFLLKK